jgi:hypothetical protein
MHRQQWNAQPHRRQTVVAAREPRIELAGGKRNAPAKA